MLLHAAFGLIWTTPYPDEKDLFLKFLFREVQKVPYEILTFFLGKLCQNFFALHSLYTVDTPYWVGFDLDNSLTRWKRTIFKIRKHSQFAKFAKFRMRTQLFSQASYTKKFFCFTLSLRWWYSIPRLVWFAQLLNPMKNTFIRISFFAKLKKSVWNTNFFADKVYQFFFIILRSHFTGDTAYRVWFDLDNSLSRWKRIILLILKYSQFAKFAKFRMKIQFFS